MWRSLHVTINRPVINTVSSRWPVLVSDIFKNLAFSSLLHTTLICRRSRILVFGGPQLHRRQVGPRFGGKSVSLWGKTAVKYRSQQYKNMHVNAMKLPEQVLYQRKGTAEPFAGYTKNVKLATDLCIEEMSFSLFFIHFSDVVSAKLASHRQLPSPMRLPVPCLRVTFQKSDVMA